MSTIYMSQLSTAFPLMEEDHHHHGQDHHQGHFQAFTMPKDPPILFPFVISNSSPSDNSSLSYGGSDQQHLRQHTAMLEPQHMIGGSSSVFSTPFPTVESIRDDMIERSSSYDPYDMEKLQATGSLKTGKWTAPAPAAKMRITRKTSNPAAAGGVKKPRRRTQAYEDHGHMGGMNQALGIIRTCSDCNTTKTPLWRSGPCGPKSLCNACGIRQRKARRAMMASAAVAPGTEVGAAMATAPGDGAVVVTAAYPKVKKEKRAADVDRSLPFKKRCKVVQDHAAANTVFTGAAVVEASADPAVAFTATSSATEPARDLVDTIGAANWSMSPTAAAACFRPSSAPAPFAVQAQDEITDAAMLLMTLSCELVRG